MEPIINPIVIYWISIVDTFRFIIMLLTGFSVAGFACLLVMSIDENFNRIKKHIIKFIIPICIGIILSIGIPSSKTLTKMIVVSYITPNNITETEETIDKTIDYIIEKIDKITNNKDED